MPSQSQLLDVRRLSRHRRRRAQQAVVARPYPAPGAAQAAQALPGKRSGRQYHTGAARCRRQRHRLRVHDERVAPQQRLSGRAVRGARRFATDGGAEAIGRSGTTRINRARSSAHRADRSRPAFSRRFIAGILAGRANRNEDVLIEFCGHQLCESTSRVPS